MNFPKRPALFPVYPLFPHQSPNAVISFPSPILSLNALYLHLSPNSQGSSSAWFVGQWVYTSARGNGLGKRPSKSETPRLCSSCCHPGKGQAATKQLNIALHSSEVILKGTGFAACLLGWETPNLWLGNSSDDPPVHRITKVCYVVLFKHVSLIWTVIVK